jgi:phosphoglycerol transferase MdoB-like AlkP superfamily enzyme
MSNKTISPQIQAFFRLTFSLVILFSFFRACFYIFFNKSSEAFSSYELIHALFLGLRFDIRVAIFVALPILFFSALKLVSWIKNEKLKLKWAKFYSIVLFLIALFYAGDIGYYAYLESRINFRIFDFFSDFMISAKMVYESYNVWLWGIGLIAFTFACYVYFKKYIFITYDYKKVGRKKNVAQVSIVSFLVVFGIHESFDQYPLRWSEAFFTQNNFLASLSMNPLHYIFDTYKNSKRDYDINKVRALYPTMAPYLGVEKQNIDTLDFRRSTIGTPKFKSHPNIVYIVMESMAAYKTGAFGNSPESSPSLDRLAKDGWLFRNYYVPTEGTARSLFCILSGVPDTNAKSTSSRNPLIIDQNTPINGFKDYEKFYFIGGSASWGNIRGVYMNNIEKLHMYEGDQLGGSRTDVWGLSDLDLFRATATVLKEQPIKPFFALIQSASFHRPYTIPDDHGDFQLRTLTDDDLKKYGFASNEEYNSFRFADYSLGEFFKSIQKSEFFKNTIFIIQGDHGLPHYGAANLTEGYKSFGINRFHTPLVFYSPLITQHEDFDMMITEPDVIPTMLGLTGFDFSNTALGRNVFAIPKNEPHYAFSYVYYSTPLQIMLYDQEFLAYGTERSIESLHKYNSPDFKTDVKEKFPQKFNEMRLLLEGMFETSKYILHHNRKIKPGTTSARPAATNQ